MRNVFYIASFRRSDAFFFKSNFRKKGFIFALLCIALSTFFAFGLTACETDGGIDENNQIVCKTLEKSEKAIRGKVHNATDTFYIAEEITLKGNASYSVYKDVECTNEIISKAIHLEIGDNIFYILEKCGKDSNLYTVTIYRLAKYTVTFVLDNGNETIEIEEGSLITEKDFPKKSGYVAVWDYDFTKPVTENVTIPAVWKQVFTVEGSSITGLTDFGKTLNSLEIPSSIDGNAINTISKSAFYKKDTFTEVRILDGITSIADLAFAGCSSLIKITIGNSVTSIGECAFSNCASLSSITIPDSITSIGSGAFFNCFKLIEVVNNSNLTITKGSEDNGYVAYYALNVKNGGTSDIVNSNGYLFYTYKNANYLLGYVGNDTELTLPNEYNGKTYEIYDCAFYGCSSLSKITIPDKVTNIRKYAFYKCTSLSSVIFGNGIKSIGYQAFYNCRSLTSISIPDSVTNIEDFAFQGCTLFTILTIPNSVIKLGAYAFANCTSLTILTIPNSVIEIEYLAFSGCTSLTRVTIGNGITSIGSYAFDGCNSLKAIYYAGSEAEWNAIDKSNAKIPTGCSIHYGK